jgi:regulatory protein spx
MVEFELYLYSGCSSCRNAEALIVRHGESVRKRDLFQTPLSANELMTLFARIGKSPQEMLATRSRPYRELGLAARSLSEGEIVALMAEYPALVRRPIVVGGERGEVGFNRAALERLVGASDKGDEDA